MGSSEDFFKRGLTTAFLKMAGNTPETRDSLNIDVIVGNIWSIDSTNKGVVMGSRSHVVGLLEVINLRTNSSVTGLKDVKQFPLKGVSPSDDKRF